MENVKEGDKVKLICKLKLEDGTTYFKNEEDKPLVVTVGEGKLFPIIENKIKDMKEGETKTVNLKPNDAYGTYNNDLVAEIPKKDIGNNPDLKIGSKIQMKTTDNRIVHGMVTELKDDTLTVDFNHPLAGKNIVFIITVKSIEKT
jgi:FKBP-type peptidyl-prolyl cis-trans isomerase 2